MKTPELLALALLAAPAVLPAAGVSSYAPESRSVSETFTSKVLKVYSCQEGQFEYVAYVIQWKDHEIVVMPLGLQPGTKPYAVGDVIRCRMTEMQHAGRTPGDPAVARMMFFIVPDAVAFDDDHRIRSAADEIQKRRTQRQATVSPAAKQPLPAPTATPAAQSPAAAPGESHP